MRLFKSREFNLDREPFVIDGIRRSREWALTHASITLQYDPRPEFEPTRDPDPYEQLDLYGNVCGRASREDVARRPGRVRWAPRREEFDTPVNPILVTFRAGLGHYETDDGEEADASQQAALWLADWGNVEGAADQIEHARVVLTAMSERLPRILEGWVRA